MDKAKDGIFEAVQTIVYALLIAGVFRTLLFQPFWIPSGSMKDTLLIGDFLFVNKMAYGYSKYSCPFGICPIEGRIFGSEPERGDVVVFRHPVSNADFIKRLIGLPGDRIQMRRGRLWVNGEQIPAKELPPVMMDSGYGFTRSVQRFEETFPNGRTFVTYDFGPNGDVDDTQTFVVPEGHYFFMGDNRDNSLDSRVPAEIGVGFVPAENLVGKAQIILLSWNPGASLFKPWTWVMNARPSRFFNILQ